MCRWFLLLLLACLASFVSAQPNPAVPPIDAPPANAKLIPTTVPVNTRDMVIETTPNGLFVVYRGVVARYHATTLQPQGSVDLFEPVPQGAAPTPEKALVRPAEDDRQFRAQVAAMLPHGDALLIIIGNQFRRVNQKTLVIEAKSTLDPGKPTNPDPLLTGALNPWLPAVVKLDGQALYVFRGPYLLLLNPTSGAITAQSTLPKTMYTTTVAIRQTQLLNDPNTTPAREVTYHGVVHHVALEGGFWALKVENGDEYVIAGGPQAKALLATPKLDGARVRVTGVVSQRAGSAMYGKGYLDVNTFQVLTVQ